MAGDANLVANLEIPDGLNYRMEEENQNLKIMIDYGAEVENLSGLATKEDVKRLRTELWIEGVSQKVNEKANETSMQNQFQLVVDKRMLEGKETLTIPIKCIAMLETSFQNDLPLYAEKEYLLTIYSGDMLPEKEEITQEIDKVHVDTIKKINNTEAIPHIISVELKRVSTDAKNRENTVDLLKVKKTGKPFIMAGQVLYLKVGAVNTEEITLEFAGDRSMITCDELTQKFEWYEPKERNARLQYSSLKALEKSYQMPRSFKRVSEKENITYFEITYLVPYQTKQTLHSWNSLREKNKSVFEIDEKELFTRIMNPYEIVLKARSSGGATTKWISLDVFEAWNTVYNRDISKYVE